ncbi:hypothetical protein F4778DRAFT_208313 [Xylariomycetidae sp. FL2044]|nr:hypothetical protein F4778DRAFT_208313 [Xylariomycetidae sp. FL2044]
MDPSLEDKLAFFEHVDACQTYDDEEDALEPREQTLREKSKAFLRARSLHISELPGPTPKRTASAPTPPHPNLDDEGIQILKVTPRHTRSLPIAPSASIASAAAETPIPETVLSSAKHPRRRPTHPLTRSVASGSDTDRSLSTNMGKRKRQTAGLRMAPESERVFTGLAFFYIPNNDVNPARRIRIARAREHGAVWVREMRDATHIIVDKGLSYMDIQQLLQEDPKSSQKILVYDSYPIDCLERRTLSNPDQAIYKVAGASTSQQASSPEPSNTQSSEASLKLKARRSARVQTQCDRDSSSSKSQDPLQISNPGIVESAPPLPDKLPIARGDTSVEDELSRCINDVLINPSLGREDDSDGEVLIAAGDDNNPEDANGSDVEPQSKRRAYGKEVKGQEHYHCMKGGSLEASKVEGPNAKIITVLEEMLHQHELSREPWRAPSYRKAIATIRLQKKPIHTYEAAMALPHIGEKLAKKIAEIVRTGALEQLEEARKDPQRQTLGLFLKIYGVGETQGKQWYAQGFRTLEDIRTKAKLNPSQRVGLEHYDDLNTRIPRREVEALGRYVKRVALNIDPEVEMIVGGSYRRGADTSGDIDLIVTKKGTSTTKELAVFLHTLVDKLTSQGFLTAELAAHRSDQGGETSKWHGCCVLPESEAESGFFPGGPIKDNNNSKASTEYRPTWRRIDFLLAPDTEIGAALLYFTGNDAFNRSIRLLAHRKGMCLNQRGLFDGVWRTPGQKRTAGVLLEGRNERRIFEILGVGWREPTDRWCG